MVTDVGKAVIYNNREKVLQIISNDEGEIDQVLLDTRDKEGKSPLDIACILGNDDMVETLIKLGANIDSVSSQGNTAMHRASSWGRIECLRVIAKCGGSLNLKNAKGEMPRDTARRFGHTACRDYLVRAAVRRDYKDKLQAYNDTLTDHDLITGKLNKEDRIQVAALFKTLWEWYETNTDPLASAIEEQTKLLLEGVLPYMRKLAPEKVSKELIQAIRKFEEEKAAEHLSQS